VPLSPRRRAVDDVLVAQAGFLDGVGLGHVREDTRGLRRRPVESVSDVGLSHPPVVGFEQGADPLLVRDEIAVRHDPARTDPLLGSDFTRFHGENGTKDA